MKKWVIYRLYRLLRPYIVVDIWKSPTTMHLYFTMRLFGKKVAEVEYSEREFVERIII